MNKTRILFIFTLLFTLVSTFAAETWETKVRNILNDKTIDEPYKRLKTANIFILDNISDMQLEEAVRLFQDILLPFIEKKMKDDPKCDMTKGNIYYNIMWLYAFQGYPRDYEETDALFKKIVEKADLLKDNFTRAKVYRGYAHFQSAMGNISTAHEYIYKAIALYELINDYESIIASLKNIAEEQTKTRNIPGVRKVIEQMQHYTEQPLFDGKPDCLNNLYFVQTIYYGLLCEEYPEIIAYKDSALIASRNTISVLENYPNEWNESSLSTAYYNMAVVYRDRYPDRYDSVYYFLNKALESKSGYTEVDAILEIHCYITYANIHFEQKKYKEAEKDILYALSLLEKVNKKTVVEYSDVYEFLAKYYETLNRPAEALKYHKLLLENERKRYDNERLETIDEMLVKYETEKKQLEIETLTKEHQTSRRIFLLTSSLLLALLIAAASILFWSRLKRKNMEQKFYETALLSELRQNELEIIQNNKQQLEHNPVKNIIENIAQLISSSLIEKNDKDAYLERISNLDAKLFENTYQTSKIKITSMDMKYILCFAAIMDVKDIGLLFNVDPASVYTVRYRIRKKLSKEDSFKIIL